MRAIFNADGTMVFDEDTKGDDMLTMTPTGERRQRGFTRTERERGRYLSAARSRALYRCVYDGRDYGEMTKRQAKRAFGARQVRRAMSRHR